MSSWQVLEKTYRRAQLALDAHAPARAVKLLRELIRQEPGEPLFHWTLGYALSDQRDYKDAIREFRQAIKLDRDNVPAWGGLGQVYIEAGKWKQAEQAIRRRLALKKSPAHYIFLADVLMQTGRFGLAAKACRMAIALDPTFAEAYLNLGLAYRDQRKTKKAIAALRKAIALDAEYALAYQELGLTYYSVERIEAAVESLEKCLTLNPGDAWAHLYLGLCLAYVGDDGRAALHFKEAIRREPDNSFFQTKYAELVARVGVNGNNSPERNGRRPASGRCATVRRRQASQSR